MNHGSTQWVKSSYSSGEAGSNCVECAPTSAAATGVVPVRDSKTPEGPTLTVSTKSFSAFIAAIKNDAF
ncbi:DUF397 domain-containing protein [Streptomyces noursei]|uniref:DUF397 domain-containing protein n=1 Tax=Streptomyces noursei TaxID=1971 RepID=UPI00344DBB05